MQLFNFISKLFCRHTKKCIRIEYRVYNSMFRQFHVKRYSINNVTRCIKCNKVLEITELQKDLTKSKLKLIKNLTDAEINSIEETIK